jgi:hypothetical protein
MQELEEADIAGGMVLNALPLASMNLVSGGGTAGPGRTVPSRRVATLVPYPPGV